MSTFMDSRFTVCCAHGCWGQLSSAVQGWRSVAARCKQSNPAASLAAAAMYVLEVTRTNDEWGSWSAGDTTFVRSMLLQGPLKIGALAKLSRLP